MESTPKKSSNIILKIFSVFIGIIIWFSVFNLSDSVITGKHTVNLGTINQEVMDKAKLSYSLIDANDIQVEYKVRTKDAIKIQKSDFNVFVDFADYSVTGAVPVYVEVLNDKEGLIKDLEVYPSIIKISTEEIQTKQFDIEVIADGELKEGFELNTIKLNKEKVTVKGPKSQVGRISKARVSIDIDNLDKNDSGISNIVFVDSNNSVIRLDSKTKLKADIESVPYEISVYKLKDVDLLITISGKPAKGSIYTSANIIPSKVTISGEPETVDKVKSINLGIIDINGRSASFKQDINVNNRIDSAISVVEDDPFVSVYVTITEIDLENLEVPVNTQVSTGDQTKDDYYGPGMDTGNGSVTSSIDTLDIISGESSTGEIIEDN